MIEVFKFLFEIITYLFKEHIKITLYFFVFLALEFALMTYHQDAYIELFLMLSLPIVALIAFMYAFYAFKFRLNIIVYDEYKSKKSMLKVLFIFLAINSAIISVHLAYEIFEEISGGHGGHSSHGVEHGAEHAPEHVLEDTSVLHVPVNVPEHKLEHAPVIPQHTPENTSEHH